MWYGDGTFSVAPQHFYQLYTLHGVVLNQVLPLAYCLLTKKSRSIYREMFTAIKSQAESRSIPISVDNFRIDFELACIRSFEDVFPEAQVECCFFHLAQAHWRKIVDLGLRQQYIEDESLSMSLRMLTALAFVPAQHIYDSFQSMKESTPEIASGFIEYMEETYVGKYCFTTELRPSEQSGKVAPLVSFYSFDHVETLPPFILIKYYIVIHFNVMLTQSQISDLSPILIMFRHCKIVVDFRVC